MESHSHKKAPVGDPEKAEKFKQVRAAGIHILKSAFLYTMVHKKNKNLHLVVCQCLNTAHEIWFEVADQTHYTKTLPILYAFSKLRDLIYDLTNRGVLECIMLKKWETLAFGNMVTCLWYHSRGLYEISQSTKKQIMGTINESLNSQQQAVLLDEARVAVTKGKEVTQDEVKNLIEAYDTTFEFIRDEAETLKNRGITTKEFENINFEEDGPEDNQELLNTYRSQNYEKVYELLKKNSQFWMAVADGKLEMPLDKLLHNLAALCQVRRRHQDKYEEWFEKLKAKKEELGGVVILERDLAMVTEMLEYIGEYFNRHPEEQEGEGKGETIRKTANRPVMDVRLEHFDAQAIDLKIQTEILGLK